MIQGINASGWKIPPFIIFAGVYHLSTWYEEEDIPSDWAIAVSEKGWTINKLGVEWLRHFNRHTRDRTVGTYRLLILDGYESHNSLEFKELCKESNIITLCIPPHASHLLQPLDVGCFAPLKKAYRRQIEDLARNHVFYISKLEFLPAFKAAFDAAFTANNICASFRGAGLILLDPEAVLSKLDVQLRTLSPPVAQEVTQWESKTPSNTVELGYQTALIRSRIQRHQDSSPTLLKSIDSLERGAQKFRHELVLVRDKVASLEKIIEAATKRKEHSKKRIQK
jgi:hypothetical protein